MGHTPGQWEVRESPNFGNFLEVISPDYRKATDADHVVCELRVWQRPVAAANARLIASAPALLEALKEAVSVCETFTPFGGIAAKWQDLIEKTEGRD